MIVGRRYCLVRSSTVNILSEKNFVHIHIYIFTLASRQGKAPREKMGKPKDRGDAKGHNVEAHDHTEVRANEYDKTDDRPFSINCEWDIKQTQQFSDDGTNTYFW